MWVCAGGLPRSSADPQKGMCTTVKHEKNKKKNKLQTQKCVVFTPFLNLYFALPYHILQYVIFLNNH